MTAQQNSGSGNDLDVEMAYEGLDLAETDDRVDPPNLELDRRPKRRRFWGNPEDPIAEDIERVVRGLASIGVLAAAVISTLQYIESNRSLESERSLGLVQAWQERKLAEDFSALQLFVEGKLEGLGEASAGLAALPPPALNAALSNLGKTWLIENRKGENPDVLEDRIDRVTLFFEQMETCIDAGLCTEKVLARYFDEQVQSFWVYFNHYAVIRQKEGYVGYGKGVARLSRIFLEEKS